MTDDITKVVSTLKEGKVILYPTDTVWGLGCDVLNNSAINKINAIKNRNENKALIILVSDTGMLNRYFKNIPRTAYDILENAVSPLTLVLDEPVNISPLLKNEDGTLGVRISTLPFNRDFIRRYGKAVVSTSANTSGQPTPSKFSQIEKTILNQCDYVCDQHLEALSTGKASRIIKLKNNGEISILR